MFQYYCIYCDTPILPSAEQQSNVQENFHKNARNKTVKQFGT